MHGSKMGSSNFRIGLQGAVPDLGPSSKRSKTLLSSAMASLQNAAGQPPEFATQNFECSSFSDQPADGDTFFAKGAALSLCSSGALQVRRPCRGRACLSPTVDSR